MTDFMHSLYHANERFTCLPAKKWYTKKIFDDKLVELDPSKVNKPEVNKKTLTIESNKKRYFYICSK